jgi:hypothetical protein
MIPGEVSDAESRTPEMITIVSGKWARTSGRRCEFDIRQSENKRFGERDRRTPETDQVF